MSDLLEKPKEDILTSDTPPDKNRHYFVKKDLDQNLLDGVAIKAVCGFIKEGLAHPDVNLPVCKKCVAIYDMMQD